MQYKDADHYKAAMKASGKFRKVNDYEVFNWALCLECVHFKMDLSIPIHGDCSLMEKEGAYNGVMAQAVCNRFLSRKGSDINGKQLDLAALSTAFKIERLKNGEIYIPR
jgi:hypothetical protein